MNCAHAIQHGRFCLVQSLNEEGINGTLCDFIGSLHCARTVRIGFVFIMNIGIDRSCVKTIWSDFLLSYTIPALHLYGFVVFEGKANGKRKAQVCS